jgi:acetyltransferase-like isoleucine patch superfamily enzyme
MNDLRIDAGAIVGDGLIAGPYVVMDEGAEVGSDARFGSFVHVCSGARVGDRVTVGDNVTIHEGAVIGDDVLIADGAVVGKRPMLSPTSTANREPLPGVVVGSGCSVGTHAVLMAGSKLGEGVIIGDGALVRERCEVGERVVVGRAVTVENDTTIGARTKIQAGAYITAYVTIEEDCFIAPMVVTTNDNYMGRTEKRLSQMKGCTIRKGARVGGGVHILPGIEVGEEAFIATGAVVTRDVEAHMLVMGAPARPVRRVSSDELLENQ